MNFKNPGAAVAVPGVETEHHAAAFAGTQAAALQYAGGTPDSSSNCLRACGTARCACLQGKALRAIPAARGLAPLDTAEPAAPDRPRSTPRRWAVLGGCAGACCGRLCECVPSTTLAVRCLCVTKDGSRIAARPCFEALHRAVSMAACMGRGMFLLVVGNGLSWVRRRAAETFVRGCRAGHVSFRIGVVRPKASLCCCESWRGRGCASGFMAATVRRKQFPLRCAHSSRDKFFSPPGSPLRCDRKRCSPPVPRRPDHNKDAMGANLVQP